MKLAALVVSTVLNFGYSLEFIHETDYFSDLAFGTKQRKSHSQLVKLMLRFACFDTS